MQAHHWWWILALALSIGEALSTSFYLLVLALGAFAGGVVA
jgi:membrane protein implicated in regulation of membrane protease activity